jgi:serine/threonine protein kinase
MIGQTISHYRIVSQLGSGGMGVVYAAEDDRLGRAVALKFVPEDLAKDSQAIERLISEARTASALNHANICTIHDIGEYQGRPFIVMELLQGQTLRDRLTAGLPKIHEVVSIGIQVADALDAAHRRHIIHRDIKPANLFLLDRGQVKILDFGLAKLVSGGRVLATTAATTDLTAEGMTLGTVSYMSPEQIAGEQLDGRTDLFSFGVVLYECVTGRQPFPGKTSAVVFSTILNQAPIAPIVFNPEMPLRLQEVINNCLEKDRELRYQDAAGLRADLMRLRRDIESGHSGVVRLTGAVKAGPPSTRAATRSSSAAARSSATPVSAQSPDDAATDGRTTTSPFSGTIAITLLVVVLIAGIAYFVSQRSVKSPETTARGPAQVLSPNPLELATASLQAKNYRAALAFSEQALQTAPNQPDALRIRDAAQSMIARFDEAVATARNLLAAGDTDGVAAALDTARAIDPTAPAIGDLSTRLMNEFKSQAEAARKERQARPPSPATSPPQRRASSEPQVTVERPRNPEPPAPLPVPPPPVQTAPAPTPQTVPVPIPASPEAAAAPTPPPTPEPAPRTGQPTPPAATYAPAARDSAPAPTPAPAPVEDDDAAIRRIVATYARAIETKDIDLFRSVKPNLSSVEQRRVEESFRSVASQRVAITILSVDRRGQEAAVRLRRRDTIQAGGREQTSESQQTMTLIRTAAGWTIREIGR